MEEEGELGGKIILGRLQARRHSSKSAAALQPPMSSEAQALLHNVTDVLDVFNVTDPLPKRDDG